MFAAKHSQLQKIVFHTKNTFSTKKNMTYDLFWQLTTLIKCKNTHFAGSFSSNSFSSLELGLLSPLKNSFWDNHGYKKSIQLPLNKF